MVILRIRQAETALSDGRLDEAYSLGIDKTVRAHRRGQALIGDLARAFGRRGQVHLADGRFDEALADADRALQLAGRTPELARMRQEIQSAIREQREDRHSRDETISAVSKLIAYGRLSEGAQLAGEMSADDREAAGLLRRVKRLRSQFDRALCEGEEAIDRLDWTAAVKAAKTARAAHGADARLAPFAARLADGMIEEVRSMIELGRIDLAEATLDRLEKLGSKSLVADELASVVSDCRNAGDMIEGGRYRDAAEILRRVRRLVPRVDWLDEAIASTIHAAEGREVLNSGPLGTVRAVRRDQSDRTDSSMVSIDRVGGGRTELPERFTIHVDGVSAFLVLRGERITIGPENRTESSEADVPLMLDPSAPRVAFERRSEDYFLSSPHPVRVNETQAGERLLTDGDSVWLTARCKLDFHLPNAASTTALLKLSGTRLPKGDARTVVLLDRSLIIGPGPNAHIRIDEMARPAVLHERGGRLYCRADSEIYVDGQAINANDEIPMGMRIRVGAMQMTMVET